MRTILICGLQGAGKTRLALNFEHYIQTPVYQLKFADPLYDMAFAIYPVLEKLGLREKFTTKKDGELLQVLGTEYGRKKYGEDVWVKIARDRIASRASQPSFSGKDYAIIDDCRFRSEFDGFPDALRIFLQCSRETRKERAEYWRSNTDHPSEVDLEPYLNLGKFDAVINTEGNTQGDTLKELLKQIERKWGHV